MTEEEKSEGLLPEAELLEAAGVDWRQVSQYTTEAIDAGDRVILQWEGIKVVEGEEAERIKTLVAAYELQRSVAIDAGELPGPDEPE